MPIGEQEYLGVIQNIEWSILNVYRDHHDLTDYQVDAALEALGRAYVREKPGVPPVLPKNPLAQEVFLSMKGVCDWQLGREQLVDEQGQPMTIDPLTVDEILGCLKRLRKSVETWNKKGGSQGYLNYIRQFLK